MYCANQPSSSWWYKVYAWRVEQVMGTHEEVYKGICESIPAFCQETPGQPGKAHSHRISVCENAASDLLWKGVAENFQFNFVTRIVEELDKFTGITPRAPNLREDCLRSIDD